MPGTYGTDTSGMTRPSRAVAVRPPRLRTTLTRRGAGRHPNPDPEGAARPHPDGTAPGIAPGGCAVCSERRYGRFLAMTMRCT
ncbi:hypothetical protein GCM10020000_49140 [Streptomyces olivoverticillatus]